MNPFKCMVKEFLKMICTKIGLIVLSHANPKLTQYCLEIQELFRLGFEDLAHFHDTMFF
jgi:hypothetical protein